MKHKIRDYVVFYFRLLIAGAIFLLGTGYWWKPNYSVNYTHGDRKNIPKEGGGWHMTYHHSGEGRPVVIFPGLGRSSTDFEELTLKLNQAGYETISMEMEINGFSQNNFDGVGEELAKLVDHTVKDRSYCLIGHDFGSDIIRQFVPKQTDSKIQAAILIAPAGESIDEYYLKKRRRLYNHWQPPHRRLNAMKELYFYEDSVVPENWKKEWRGWRASTQAYIYDNSEREAWADNNQIPVLMLHGENDPVHSADDALKSMRDQNILNIDVKIVPKTSRAFIPEQPTLLASETIEFLNKHCRS